MKKSKETRQLNEYKSNAKKSAVIGSSAFLLPTAAMWATSPESKDYKILYTIMFFLLVSIGFGPRIYKNTKKYIQLKKNLQKQNSR